VISDHHFTSFLDLRSISPTIPQRADSIPRSASTLFGSLVGGLCYQNKKEGKKKLEFPGLRVANLIDKSFRLPFVLAFRSSLIERAGRKAHEVGLLISSLRGV
jgi:hypothetical protein